MILPPKSNKAVKIEDTFIPTNIKTGQTAPSRMEEWWKKTGFGDIYKKFRKSGIPSKVLSIIDIENVGSYFNLQGYAFGNWVTQGDKYNYLAATAVCLEDLNRILKFKGQNVGLNNHVAITYGARGKKGAVAHYEPQTGIINLNRYKAISSYYKGVMPSHEDRFLYTGGVGALCHELGHALDFYGGAQLDLDSKIYSLSGGHMPYEGRKIYNKRNNNLRILLENILAAACLNNKEEDFSTYYKRLTKLNSSKNKKEYFLRRTELFARLFEQYIAHKLREIGVVNTLLTQKNYKPLYYPNSKEFERVIPPFDLFITEYRKRLASTTTKKAK